MVRVKSASQIAQKWAKVTPQRQDDYKTGVEDNAVDWESGALASKKAYEQGVQESISKDARSTGIKNAGTDKWRKGAAGKGVDRWGPGVRNAEGDFEKGFAPFRDVIENTTLPARGPKGDPNNLQRVAAIAKALHAKKVKG